MKDTNKVIDRTLVVGPFQCNCRLLVCPKTGDAALIDAGDEAEKILTLIQDVQKNLNKPIQLKYLFHTHGHLDHVGGTRQVKLKHHSSKIALHSEDLPLYSNLKIQGQRFGFQYEDPLPVDHFLQEGENFQVGELKFSVIHTPGHSPGSVCLRLHEDFSLGIQETLFSGDTLFRGSVGRTDLWGANGDQMFKSIHQRILTLDDDTCVCPGHGPSSTIGIEKRSNPYLN